MKLVRASELGRALRIPGRTIRQWCRDIPGLGKYIEGGIGGGSWWIKIDKLVGKFGIGIIEAYTLGTRPWVTVSELSKVSGISTKTINNWCRSRPGFACRIGRNYYIDLEQLGASEEQVRKLLDGDIRQSQTEEEEDD